MSTTPNRALTPGERAEKLARSFTDDVKQIEQAAAVIDLRSARSDASPPPVVSETSVEHNP